MNQPGNPTIVLAAFGPAQPKGLVAISRVMEAVRAAFPRAVVRPAFTSQRIRGIWHKRADDPAWRAENPKVPGEVYAVESPLAALERARAEGAAALVLQPLNLVAGVEYDELAGKLADWPGGLALGRPALGLPGSEYPYLDDLTRAARALAPDAEQALAAGTALVYAGHGTTRRPSGIYLELAEVLRREYAGLAVVVGMMEGYMGLEYVTHRLREMSASKVLLKPLLLTAGEHARKDICGQKPESWQSRLTAAGFTVTCDLRGVGELPAWPAIYVGNIRDAAAAAGINLA